MKGLYQDAFCLIMYRTMSKRVFGIPANLT